MHNISDEEPLARYIQEEAAALEDLIAGPVTTFFSQYNGFFYKLS